ncbi:MAG: TrbC/VirB2 family protein [Pseudomonadota bacterium]
MDNSQKKSAESMIDLCWRLTLFFSAVVVYAIIPEAAFAAAGAAAGAAATTGAGSGDNAISQVFCNVVLVLQGTTGKAIATVAVIAIGVGALIGKVSWGTALIVALGVALIFGASSIVDSLSGHNAQCSASSI